jgi:hypothetical protein
MKKIILAVSILCFILLVGCASAQKYPSGIDFELIGYFQANPGEKGNNSNGVLRLKTYYVSNFKDDPQVWTDIEKHAKSEMWSEGDVTVIFYFNDKQHTPGDIVTLAKDYDTALNFPESYNKYCVAGYWKYSSGKEQFIRYPLK